MIVAQVSFRAVVLSLSGKDYTPLIYRLNLRLSLKVSVRSNPLASVGAYPFITNLHLKFLVK